MIDKAVIYISSKIFDYQKKLPQHKVHVDFGKKVYCKQWNCIQILVARFFGNTVRIVGDYE